MQQDVDDFPLQLTQRLARLHHAGAYPDFNLDQTQVAFLCPRPQLQHIILAVNTYRLNEKGEFENGQQEEVSTSAWAQLPCFTGLKRPKKVKEYRLRLGNEDYDLFPFGFALSPNCFFICPIEATPIISQALTAHSQLIIREFCWSLSTCLDLRFPLKKLADLTEERDLLRQFGSFLCETLLPLSWRIVEKGQASSRPTPYLTREFTADKYQPLTIQLPEGGVAQAIQLFFPERFPAAPATGRINEADADLLAATLCDLYKQLQRRWQDLHQLAPYEQTVSLAEQRLARIELEMIAIKEQLRLGAHQYHEEHGAPIAEAASHPFVLKKNRAGHWVVCFDSRPIPRMPPKGCQYFSFLMQHPNETFDVLWLRQHFELAKDIAKEKKHKVADRPFDPVELRRFIDKLQADRIDDTTIREALLGSPEEQQDIKQKIDRYCNIYERINQHIKGYEDDLQHYRFLQAKYNWQQEVDFTQDYQQTSDRNRPLSNKLNTAQCKTANERISKNIDSFRDSLKTAGQLQFLQYTRDTLNRVTNDGLHYYTFQPQQASDKKLRDLSWDL